VCDETGRCTQCRSEDLLIDNVTGDCIKKPAPITCPSNQIYNVTTGICDPCSAACDTCYNLEQGKCIQCKLPSIFFENTCAVVLDGGKCRLNTDEAFVVDNKRQLCEPCPSSCLDCIISNFTRTSPIEDMICTKCMPGFVLKNGECIKDCGEGKYVDANFVCQGKINLIILTFFFDYNN
jgi:hypothetical protein